MILRVVCVVNFLFPTLFGLLRKSLQKKKHVSQSGNREERWLVEDRAGNRQQITDSLRNPQERGLWSR